ncbi:MAG: signal peptide peptidase SppA [Alphaproteobacteria bacterium]|nr:MAG: signal peptide peptidase SppA [Alphaproteobacteria bacterium]TAF13630.1 MAG: signal peptide peptidase SppA [Alphaproteobacteria bacterium]TAF41723.1 MAG: signal peptide peptidase SppA [Alphaproteobacteria bacterium]TAF75664.1 MAG: signal peptide peptidase SppA [Alphaproteobacteria bacterium]
MALTSDSFIERSYLRKQVTKWKMVALAVVVLSLISFFEKNQTLTDVTSEDYIARITIEGVIVEDDKLFDLLDQVANDKHAKALILHLNSPGGTAVAGEVLLQKIKDIREKKPVVSSMRSLCASACYMISLASDRSFAMQGTITGSIGVIFQMAEMSELAQKIGITPITIKSGTYKGSPSMDKPITDDERAIIQSMIDEFHNVFVQMVSDHRKIPVEQVRILADGRIYSAQRAKELNLVDALGGEKEARAWLATEKKIAQDLEVRPLHIKSRMDNFLEKLEESADIPNMVSGASRSGLMLTWQPSIQNLVN